MQAIKPSPTDNLARNVAQNSIETNIRTLMEKVDAHGNPTDDHFYAIFSEQTNTSIQKEALQYLKNLANTKQGLLKLALLPIFEVACDEYTELVTSSIQNVLESKILKDEDAIKRNAMKITLAHQTGPNHLNHDGTIERGQIFQKLIQSSQSSYLRATTKEKLSELITSLNAKNAFVGLDLTGSDLSKMSLVGLNLSHCVIHQANLEGANLAQINLTHADIKDVSFAGAFMPHANLTDAKVINVDLSNTGLGFANLTRADLLNSPLLFSTTQDGIILKNAKNVVIERLWHKVSDFLTSFCGADEKQE